MKPIFDFALIGEATFDALFWVDHSGKVVDANEAARALLAGRNEPLPLARVAGRPLLELTRLRPLLELCHRARSGAVHCESDVRLLTGPERLLRARAIPLGEGESAGCLLVLSDRTELSHLRRVRTEFVANVSHELRTPLAAIRAMAETLRDGAREDPEVSERFLGTIIHEVDRLVRLSEDLLLLSRAEISPPDLSRFDVGELADEVVERLQPYAHRRQITIDCAGSKTPLWIDGDRGRIDQVVFNLLDNAIKYTPTGGTVRLEWGLEQDGRVAIAVTDTGIGILSEDLPRIFERFWRADRARTFPSEGGTATGGTGLGLSIVKHIIEAHGGIVTAESELGRGSRFRVLLPASSGAPSGFD